MLTGALKSGVYASCNPLAGIQVFHTSGIQINGQGSCLSGCNPLAGIQVFHTWVAVAILKGGEYPSCNPLAGIQVFHTPDCISTRSDRGARRGL